MRKNTDPTTNDVAETDHGPLIWIRPILTVTILLTLIALLDTRFGLRPALGPLLNPYNGVWLRPLSPFEARDGKTILLEGVSAPVEIQVDRDQIKHIFAQNDEDLYFAQGYVTAADRLWQMEFLTRLAEGRLSEIMGRRTLEFDKYFVKIGLSEAAKASSDLMLEDPLTGLALRAYARGVEAYRKTLTPDRYPFEYKLLGHEPMPWTADRAALLLKFMSYNLSGLSYDVPLTRSYGKFARNDFASLYPLDVEIPEPIVPKGTKWSFGSRAPQAPPPQLFQPNVSKLSPIPLPHAGNGSNNWAVTGKKSTTGHPILSNDIHLGLSLPSLWYEVQLVTPKMNAYGISLPGAPGIILGFNDKVAWGVTNGTTDILDWFELRFRDEKKSEYLYDNVWRPVISREVKIPVRGEPEQTVLLRRAHLGPIVYDEGETPIFPTVPTGLAMRWGALEGTNELRTFLLLNRAKNLKSCREAIEGFQAPDQNFLCADQKDVGLWHMGRYPVRWAGQGRMVGDGSSSLYDWHGWIPRNEVPFAQNPERGFLSSANQSPTDQSYPHYLGWGFEPPFRGMRINEILRSKPRFSPEDFVEMQFDTVSVAAKLAAPPMLKALEGAAGLTANETKAIETLAKWDYRHDTKSLGAALFSAWWRALEDRMYARVLPDRTHYKYPEALRTIRIIQNEPQAKWFDDPETPTTETLKEASLAALRSAMKEVEEKTGASDPSKWTWAAYRKTRFEHMGRIPGLGNSSLEAPGSPNSIFANTSTHGPVWKLVVALGPGKPKAWGMFPGGQAGDPLSRHFDDFVEPWVKGEMKEIVFLESSSEANPRLRSKWKLEGKNP